jgi:SAM-dependent methyltransferase
MSKILEYISALKHIGLTKNELKSSNFYFQKQIEKLSYELDIARSEKEKLDTALAEAIKNQTKTEDMIVDIKHKLSLSNSNKTSSNDTEQHSKLLAYNHLLDNFYVEFEKNYRGSEEEILQRQSVYLDRFDKYKDGKSLVVDVGCGRGEFLVLLKDNGVLVEGLDLNIKMVEETKKKGIKAFEKDVLSYLSTKKSKSIGAITGFHIVEHIPFEELMAIFEESYRTLIKGGFVLFETPNPENVLVGSNRFYNDPSHLKPIPPTILDFMLKTIGFKTEIIRLHPEKTEAEITKKSNNELLTEIAHNMFGPQDYAVIGYK